MPNAFQSAVAWASITGVCYALGKLLQNPEYTHW